MKSYEKPEIMIQTISSSEALMSKCISEPVITDKAGFIPSSNPVTKVTCAYTSSDS